MHGSQLQAGGGLGLTAGSGGYGISVSASVNAGRGHADGNGLTHTEPPLTAGNGLSLNAGRDTTLTGAQVRGDSVKVDTGRNLTLTSEQDSDRYDSKQQNARVGGSFTFGSMTGSASVNLSQDKMHSNWQSVDEQTGIFAGKGGFDVTAGENTQLNGAVISSTATATADKNRLDTGTLGFSSIEKHADYKTEHQSVGMSTGGSIGSQFEGNMANGLLAGLNGSGSASSVSDGTIVIRDKGKQTQDVSALSRDAVGANPGLDKIFYKEKEQRRMETAQLVAEIGRQAGDIARTQGDIIATKAANERMSGVTQGDRDRALAELKAKDPTKQYSDADVSKQVYSNYYNQAYAESGFGTGGKVQQAISAVTAAVQGLSGGSVAQALSGAASPYVATEIHRLTEGNPEAQAMAHAVLGAVTSYAAGNSALAGAAGGVSGELLAQLVMKQLYPGKKVGDLSETEKQTIGALGTLAAGLAGGVTGDSTADAVAGAQAGQNAVNNNLFGGTEAGQETFVREHGKDVMSCADAPTSASCQRGQAINDALTVALPAGLGGGVLIAATPEIAALLKTGVESCAGALALCINNLGLQASEIIVPGGVGVGGAVGVGKTAAEAVAAKAEAATVSAAKNSQLPTGTVFDSIKATQPVIPGASIPKSFELNVNGQTVWVNPNATKHMGEYLTRNGLSHSTTERSQAMLTSLQSAIKDASSQGLRFNEKMQVGRWELIFSQRLADPCPVLKHALYK